ncbi:MAG: alpha/beta fold hydrolase [Pseudomonadota bacterium]
MARLILALLALAAIALAVLRLEAGATGLVTSSHNLQGTPVTVQHLAGAPPGPAVVIAHGFSGSRPLMQAFAVSLARSGYAAVSFDFQGHGRNPTPLAGDVTSEDGATRALLAELQRVIAFARGLPQGDGRIALLGHSMASDIVVRAARADTEIAATIAVSMFTREVTPTAPRNLLIIVGAYERFLGAEALKAVALASGAEAADGVTHGDPATGTGRRAVFADGTEHASVLFSREAMAEAVTWLHASFALEAPPHAEARGPWIALLLAGVVALAWPLAGLLPRLGAGGGHPEAAPRPADNSLSSARGQPDRALAIEAATTPLSPPAALPLPASGNGARSDTRPSAAMSANRGTATGPSGDAPLAADGNAIWSETRPIAAMPANGGTATGPKGDAPLSADGNASESDTRITAAMPNHRGTATGPNGDAPIAAEGNAIRSETRPTAATPDLRGTATGPSGDAACFTPAEALPTGRIWALCLLPAVLTPLILWPLPTHFLPVLVADYLAVHFALYGGLTLAGLWLGGVLRPSRLSGALAVSAGVATLYCIAAIALPIDRYVASFLPIPERWPLIGLLAVGTLLYTLADAWLIERSGARWWWYPLSKLCLLASLAAAIALDLEGLFFLIIIFPIILLFFVLYGLLQRWIWRATGAPEVGGIAVGLAFAWALGVTFPMLAG